MNQTLEGHAGSVVCCTWNPVHRKLTTSDEKGLIIVWMLHKGTWYEEMINNRNKSIVKDMKWTADGKRICIIYEDGAIIVGSVDGNRLWGKELNILLKNVMWSPDSRLLLFVTQDNDVLVYDSDGTRIKTMPMAAIAESNRNQDEMDIVGIDWYEGGSSASNARSDTAIPALAIAFDNGTVQLSRSDDDQNPIIFHSDLKLRSCKWNPSGMVLALSGNTTPPEGAQHDPNFKSLSMLKFYSRYGVLLRAMRIPGEDIACLTWEGSGLRIALAVDSFIYFANVRPAYTWCYFLNTVAYCYQRREPTVQFWNLTTGEMHPKPIPGGVHFLLACGDHCVIVTSEPVMASTAVSDKNEDEKEDSGSGSKKKKLQYVIQLRNGIGALVASKNIPFVPKYMAMSANQVAAANDRTLYTWQFQSAVTKSGLINNARAILDDDDINSYSNGSPSGDRSNGFSGVGVGNAWKERMIDVDSVHGAQAQAPETYRMITDPNSDPISCICSSDRHLMVGRRSGTITRLLLPHLSAENVYQVRGEPFRMELSCMSSKLAIIDAAGVMQVIDLEARAPANEEEEEDPSALGSQFGRKIGTDKRDVWDIKWAEDNDDLLCIMEKTKMTVMRDNVAEEPVISSGYLARFRDLEIRAVLLDEIMLTPDKPERDFIVDFETKALRELRDMIGQSGLEVGYIYATKNPHSRLYRILAEQSLEALELTMAEKCFVKIGDYHGVQLVKLLRSMTDKMKMKAEVAAYLQHFAEAESIYIDIDRKDLAVQVRSRIGDYNRVVKLVHEGAGGSDKMVMEALDKIAEQYADRFMWKKAAQYFQQSKNLERLADCLYRMESFEELSSLKADVSDGTPLLLTLAGRFESVGMYEEAVDCYVRSNNPKAAVDCCVLQNRWDKALELAEEFEFPQVEGLLLRFAATLNEGGRKLEAVELYRRANRPTDAALLINEIAEHVARRDVKPSLAKRLQVLSAHEIERHRKRTLDAATKATMQGGDDATAGTKKNIALATAATLETLMMTSLDTQTTGLATMTTAQGGRKTSRAFGSAWRAAAAYHYHMLAQKQYHEGNMDAAMKTSIKLCEYDDILSPRDIYSLLALTAFSNKFFAICSQAFVKVDKALYFDLFLLLWFIRYVDITQLETLQDIPADERDAIETLAVKVFVRNVPADPITLPEVYNRCLNVGKAYKACVASGRLFAIVVTIWCTKWYMTSDFVHVGLSSIRTRTTVRHVDIRFWPTREGI